MIAIGVPIDLNRVWLAVCRRACRTDYDVGLGLGFQHDFLLAGIPAGQHPIVLVNLVREHGAGELGLQFRADQPAQLTRAEFGPETSRGQVFDERLVDDEFDTLAMGGALHALELQLDNGADLHCGRAHGRR